MRILVLGGTAFLSAAVASEAVARGHAVTCLARGSSSQPPAGAQWVQADRDVGAAAYTELTGDWDAVVEVSSEPSHVRDALAALADRARHWTYVSSCSVYADHDQPGADESAAVVAPYVGVDSPGPEEYGAAKAACEQLGRDRLGDRLQVCRPGLVVGPGDTSDRFGYWVARCARSCRPVLVPARGDVLVQVIDVGDLARWIVDSSEQARTGTFTLVGDPLPLAELLRTVQLRVGHPGPLVEVDDDWLAEHGVAHWSGPESLPLWLPTSGFAGFGARSNAAAHAAGLVLTPLEETVAAVLDDEQRRGVDRFRRAGLPPQIETRLLSLWTPDV